MTDREKYEDLLARLRKAKDDNDVNDERYCCVIDTIVPELKKSESERIREALIKFHKSTIDIDGIKGEDVLAWLEKQGEQKPFVKYKVGDTIYYDSFGRLVSFVIANIVEDGTDTPMYEDKDGNSVFQNDIVEKKPAWSEDDKTALGDALWAIQQARTIAKDENDMGNLWYAERWLKSLKDRVQPKQEWSEEDCNQIETIACHLDNIGNEAMAESLLNIMNKYKSCRPQNTWKPSDEQMEALLYEVNAWDEDSVNGQNLRSLYQNLKKLKEG